jgi:hypothetical protein
MASRAESVAVLAGPYRDGGRGRRANSGERLAVEAFASAALASAALGFRRSAT